MILTRRCLRASSTAFAFSSSKCRQINRKFSASPQSADIRSITQLPSRTQPQFKETTNHDLLALQWSQPLRNNLVVCKDNDPAIRRAVVDYATHIHSQYPDVSLIFEPHVARDLHGHLPAPIYTCEEHDGRQLREKVDLTTTLGGDGTILHAAALFATARSVPPILSFSMGTLGFLGEWKFGEYERAFREVYLSRSGGSQTPNHETTAPRHARVLMRNRLKVGLFDVDGTRLPHDAPFAHAECDDVFALNEVLLHRGALPHLSQITILIGTPPHQKILTTAIADGFLVSTPTGSTAYSLSSGGSIVHPLVDSILLTPICPRSLSFRPLVLPANTAITLRIEPSNRAKEIEVSVDGVRRQNGLKAGMEVRVVGEEVRTSGAPGIRDWRGGVPSIVRSSGPENGQDHWVGGLNSLLKFNYPFGEDG